MSSEQDALQGIEAACDYLRKQLFHRERIAALERENEQLRQERDAYWKLCGRIAGDDIRRNEAAWEEELRKGMATATPFDDVLREVEAVLGQPSPERRDGR